MNRGKAVLASLGNAPNLGVQVAPPVAKAASAGQYGFTANNPAFAPLADELTMMMNGDLSFLADGRMTTTGTPVKPDKDKRKRDAMADVLEGKA